MVEMVKVNRKGIDGEAKQGMTTHLISMLIRDSHPQATNQEKSYGTIAERTQKWADSSIRMIFPLYTRIDTEQSKKIFMGEVAEESVLYKDNI